MMSQRITAAVEELQAEKTQIQTKLDDLRRQVKSGEAQLKQIQRALTALDNRPRAKTTNKRPAATRQEVVKAMSDVLRDEGPLKQAELKKLVAEKITDAGNSRMGLALSFKAALNDDSFVCGDDGIVSDKAKTVSA
jgi:DNA repair exonuclease SbcCD ATPase subunit